MPSTPAKTDRTGDVRSMAIEDLTRLATEGSTAERKAALAEIGARALAGVTAPPADAATTTNAPTDPRVAQADAAAAKLPKDPPVVDDLTPAPADSAGTPADGTTPSSESVTKIAKSLLKRPGVRNAAEAEVYARAVARVAAAEKAPGATAAGVAITRAHAARMAAEEITRLRAPRA